MKLFQRFCHSDKFEEKIKEEINTLNREHRVQAVNSRQAKSEVDAKICQEALHQKEYELRVLERALLIAQESNASPIFFEVLQSIYEDENTQKDDQIRCLLGMKEGFEALLDEENDPLSLIRWGETLPLAQFTALIAALIDSDKISKEALLAGGIFQVLYVTHCAMDAAEVEKVHAKLKRIIQEQNSAWIDGLSRVSAGIERQPQITLTGGVVDNAEPVPQITYAPPKNRIRLTPKNWEVLQQLFGEALLLTAFIYEADENKNLLKAFVSGIPPARAVTLFQQAFKVQTEALNAAAQCMLQLMTSEQKEAILADKESGPIIWHVFFNLEPAKLNECLKKIDIQQLKPSPLDLSQMLKLIERVADRDTQSGLTLRLYQQILENEGHKADSFLKYKQILIDRFQATPAVLADAQVNIEVIEEAIIQKLLQKPFDWISVHEAIIEHRSKAHFLNQLVSPEKRTLLGEDAYCSSVFVITRLASLEESLTLAVFKNILAIVSEYRDDDYRIRIIWAFFSRASQSNITSMTPIIIEYLRQTNQLDALLPWTNDDGDTIYHLIALYPKTLEAILSHFPERDCIKALEMKNRYGETILNRVTYNPESLRTILLLLPKQDRIKALEVEDVFGRTVLHQASNKPESLKIILSFLPEQDRIKAVEVQDKYGETVLHRAAYNPESLKTILSLYQEQDRIKAVEVKDYRDQTVLHMAAYNPESLKTILSLYQERDRIKAVEVKNTDGKTVLHWVAYNPESLATILSFLPEQDRIKAVEVQDKYDRTVLHWAANTPESLKTILSLLPEKDRIEAIQIKDNEGRSAGDKLTEDELFTIIKDACKAILTEFMAPSVGCGRFFNPQSLSDEQAMVMRLMPAIDGAKMLSDIKTALQKIAQPSDLKSRLLPICSYLKMRLPDIDASKSQEGLGLS